MTPDSVSYTVLISSLCLLGCIDDALKAFSRLQVCCMWTMHQHVPFKADKWKALAHILSTLPVTEASAANEQVSCSFLLQNCSSSFWPYALLFAVLEVAWCLCRTPLGPSQTSMLTMC